VDSSPRGVGKSHFVCVASCTHTQAGSEPEPEDEGEAVEVFSEPTSILCVCTSLPTHL